MKTIFADSYFFIALLCESDTAHAKAVAFCRDPDWEIITTEWNILEVADGMARSRDRSKFVAFVQQLPQAPHIRVIPISRELYLRGLDHYCVHNDKAWSLTDSLSFIVMQDEKIAQALTADKHFEQAGFRALMK